MGHRDDRDRHADEPRDVGRRHAAGVHDDVGADRALVGHDLVHAAAAQRDLGHARARADLGAVATRAVGQREGELARVEVAVLRQPGGAQDALGRHEREALLRLGRRDDLERQPEGLGPARLPAQLLHALRARREAEAADLVPAGILAGLAPQIGVQADRVHHHPGQADRRAQLADEAGRVPGRAGREVVLLDEHDVLPAEPREVVGDARATDASADHDGLGLAPHGRSSIDSYACARRYRRAAARGRRW